MEVNPQISHNFFTYFYQQVSKFLTIKKFDLNSTINKAVSHFHREYQMSAQSCYKIVVVGTSGVGKTAMVQRLVDNTFQEETQSTVGVEFKSFNITLDTETIKLNIWDTAGQERFRSVSKAYFRNAVGAILVFALNNADSFNELESWLNDLHTLAAPNAAVVLIGNKSDLVDDRAITESEAQSFADRHAMTYIETSAREGTNISEAFLRLAKSINDKVKKGEIKGQFQPPTAPAVPLSTNPDPNPKQTCKC
ncbi:Ras family protein [Tritrichomonas foetus]|uniref:Ras family protein n=1 Tax=Tritrichomonas foetus TaxID=1144522 RepID=A0A1J4K0Z1_9EUKA|nr:Ras family protein [Tritrichomonas foetus]|eukprot:OHT04626.1 Ras family protein [Tritrichomonas foetus]